MTVLMAICFTVAYLLLLIGVGWAAGVCAFMGLVLYALKYGNDETTTNKKG